MKLTKGSSLGREKLAFWPDSVAHVTREPDRASLPEFALPIQLRARDGMVLVDVTGLISLAGWRGPIRNRAEWIDAATACRFRGLCVPALPEALYVRPDGTLCLIALPYDEPSPGTMEVLADVCRDAPIARDEFDSFTPYDGAEPIEPKPAPPTERPARSAAFLNLDFSHPSLEPGTPSAGKGRVAARPNFTPHVAPPPPPVANVDPSRAQAESAAPKRPAAPEQKAAPTPPFDDGAAPSREDRPPRSESGKGLRRLLHGRGKPRSSNPLDDLFLEGSGSGGAAGSRLFLSKKRSMTRGAIPVPMEMRVMIGRTAAKARIVLPHKDVSERHASISFEHGAYYLTDEHSSYGTRINGVRLEPGQPQRISPLDEIYFASNRYYAVFAAE